MSKHEPISIEAQRYTEWAIGFASRSGTPKKRIDWMLEAVEGIIEDLRVQDGANFLLNFDYEQWRRGVRPDRG